MTIRCPYCEEIIQSNQSQCPFCKEMLRGTALPTPKGEESKSLKPGSQTLEKGPALYCDCAESLKCWYRGKDGWQYCSHCNRMVNLPKEKTDVVKQHRGFAEREITDLLSEIGTKKIIKILILVALILAVGFLIFSNPDLRFGLLVCGSLLLLGLLLFFGFAGAAAGAAPGMALCGLGLVISLTIVGAPIGGILIVAGVIVAICGAIIGSVMGILGGSFGILEKFLPRKR